MFKILNGQADENQQLAAVVVINPFLINTLNAW